MPIFSERSREGYLMIDHSQSPGITPEQAAIAGHGTMPVGRGVKFESPTCNCSHCTRMVILNTNRSRPRTKCFACQHYICDDCALVLKLSGECRPFVKFVDDWTNWAASLDSSTKPPPESPSDRNQRFLKSVPVAPVNDLPVV